MRLLSTCHHPTEVKAIEGTLEDGETVVTRPSDDDEPFSALAFKIATDPFVGTLILRSK